MQLINMNTSLFLNVRDWGSEKNETDFCRIIQPGKSKASKALYAVSVEIVW
jgi:hypothetical protein